MLSTQKFRSYAAVATLAVALAPAASFGVSYDINRTTTVAGALPSGSILPDSTGDSVLYPFYTTAEGASTTFNLTNTSADETIVAKVRFRDQVESRDALDFLVVLSPEDKFGFWVEQDGNGRPTAYWYDNSCVIGGPGNNPGTPEEPQLKTLPFPVDADATGSVYPSWEESAVGHVEVIGLLNLENVQTGAGADLAAAAAHDIDGVPVNCNLLVRAFRDRAAVNALRAQGNGEALSDDGDALLAADVGNVLNGSMVVTADGKAIEAGTDGIMVRNTFTRGFLAAQSAEACLPATDASFTTLNQGTDACYSAYSWDGVEDTHPSLADINWVGPLTINTVAVLDELLAAQFGVSGEWSNNETNNVGFDWVTTFPTKYVYLSWFPGSGWLIGNVGNKITGVLPFLTAEAPFLKTTLPEPGCVGGDPSQLNWSIFGVEEDTTETESPGENPLAQLCNEVTIVTIKSASQNVSDIEPSLIQTAVNRGVVSYDASLDPATRGWVELPFTWNDNADVPTHAINNLAGAAVSSLLWLIRSIDDDGMLNNGSLRGNNNVNEIVIPTP
jgi:hypothetical protein